MSSLLLLIIVQLVYVYGVEFSGVFTNNTVLQREPHHAALYGSSRNNHTDSASDVQITLIFKNENNGESEKLTTNAMSNGDWKIILPKTYRNGGNYTLTAYSTEPNSSQQTIYNVTFGDVYICSGQSNMVVPMKYTFSRNYTYSNITQLGKYGNIRFLAIGTEVSNFCIMDENISYVTPQTTIPRYQWQQNDRIDLLDQFSAPCWYFAQVLSDKYKLSNITFGLIGNICGGSIIESWIKNYTIDTHCDPTDHIPTKHGFGCLYNGLVLPYINTTIKAGLWYQGENDVGHYPPGNVLNNTGYSCLEKLLITQWRSNWSVVANTTDPLFHFGLVTLASGTSEGHESSMGGFRWSQTLNYDIMPNSDNVGINTFVAQGYDIGDPWTGGCQPYCNKTTAPYSTINTHNLDNSNLHPRPKIYVGQRLARGASKFIYGNDNIWSGPLISGCSFSAENNKIIINFNKTMLYDETVIVQPWKLWYNTSMPAPLHWTAFQVLTNKTKWQYTNDAALSQGTDGLSVIVDVSEFDGLTIDGIRYAWNDYPCCGQLNKKMYPCPMNSCPIITSKTLLPAPPIWAIIQNNKCLCYAPQKC